MSLALNIQIHRQRLTHVAEYSYANVLQKVINDDDVDDA